MATEVTLEDQNGNILKRAKVAENAEIARLLPALITSLQLPITDDAGRPIRYHLSHNNMQLQDHQTLAGAEVQNGDTLVIVPEMTAGAQFETTDPNVPEPLVTLEPTIDTYQPIAGFPQDCAIDAYTSSVQIAFKPGTIQQIFAQARAHISEEVAGILLGNIYEENERFFVVVHQVLEARYTFTGAASVTFTDKTWLDLLQQRSASSFPVVGWYHSHPGFGIFLSSSDEFIQRSFFSNRLWYIALVVDPIAEEWGAFAWEERAIMPCTKGPIGKE